MAKQKPSNKQDKAAVAEVVSSVVESKSDGSTAKVSAGGRPRPKPFGMKSRHVPYTLIEDRLPFGTAGSITKPVYVPPDIEIAWATAPRIDDGADVAAMQMEGFDFVPLDKVTDDPDEAIREGKICLRTTSGFGDVDGVAGLQNFGLVLMFRPKDIGDAHRSKMYQAWDQRVRAQLKHTSGEVSSKRGAANKLEQMMD